MIRELSVKDFAIIEDLNINFNEGMTVLTGETGAGKSLIIDTISLFSIECFDFINYPFFNGKITVYISIDGKYYRLFL